MKRDQSSEHVARWLSEDSDASPALRDFLREAITHPEDAARAERLRQRLGPWLGATAPPPPTHAATAATGSTLAAVGKACLSALAVGTLVGGGAWILDRGAPPPKAAPHHVVSVSVALPSPPLPSAATPPSSPPFAAPPPASSGARSLLSRKARSSLAEEAAELATAQRLLASSPARSLALLHEHAEKFPRGALAEERSLFIIEALVALSRLEEARRELARLQLGYPSSAHLGRARRLVGMDAAPQ